MVLLFKGIAPPSQFPAAVASGAPPRPNHVVKKEFSGARKWAEMLHHPCILGDPQTKGDTIRIGCLSRAFWGPTSGRKCYVTPAFSGIPNKGDKIKA